MSKKICIPAIVEMLNPLAAGNVFIGRAPQGQKPPFIIVQKLGGDRFRDMKGPAGVAQNRVQIDAYDERYNNTAKLGTDIEAILDGFTGAVYYGDNDPQDEFVEIIGLTLIDEGDILDETDHPILWRNNAEYLVSYKQN